MTGIELFAALIVAHAVCDYPLQGDFLAKAKNETAPILGVPWWQAMGAHCAIHAGAVGFLTGSVLIGAAEGFCHFAIDRAKCRGLIGFNQDQAWHVACKAAWAVLSVAGLAL